MKKTFLMMALLVGFGAQAQHMLPFSFNTELDKKPTRAEIQSPEITSINLEDEKNEFSYRFGIALKANIEFKDFKQVYSDGDKKVWQIQIESPSAKGLGLYFDQFLIPNGGELFVFTDDKKQLLGPFTSADNIDGGTFATSFLLTDKVILEYTAPNWVIEKPIVDLEELGYFYRDVEVKLASLDRDFGDSDLCEVNVNCSEGANWQNQRDATVRISFRDQGSFYWCSGTIMNNTAGGCTPYIISADHCAENSTSSDLGQSIFYLKYQSVDCNNPPNEASINYTVMTGCSKKAQSTTAGDKDSDFILIELNDTIAKSTDIYYSGWDNSGDIPTSGVSIHHPAGDVKKISTYGAAAVSDTYGGVKNNTHWRVNWVTTANGHAVTEGGSSGSGMFDPNGRLVGTLTGGAATCNSQTAPDYYGKFWHHWDQDYTAADRRLDLYLDPNSTGTKTLDGTRRPCQGLVMSVDRISEDDIKFRMFPNPSNGILEIERIPENANIKIYNQLGKVVFLRSNYQRTSIFLDLVAGFYLVKVSSSVYSSTQKLIVKP